MVNNNKLEDLIKFGVSDSICKLLTSEIEEDFLIGWELISDMPNCEMIRAYCKGNTGSIESLNGFWSSVVDKYWTLERGVYHFNFPPNW